MCRWSTPSPTFPHAVRRRPTPSTRAPHPIDQDSDTSVLDAVAGEPEDTVAIASVSSVSSDSDAPEPDDGTVVMPAVRSEERSGDADEDDMPTVGIPVGDGGTDSEDQPSGE